MSDSDQNETKNGWENETRVPKDATSFRVTWKAELDQATGKSFRAGKVICGDELRYVIPDKYRGCKVLAGETSLCGNFSRVPIETKNGLPVYTVKVRIRNIQSGEETEKRRERKHAGAKLENLVKVEGPIRARNEFCIEKTRIGTFVITYDKEIRWKVWSLLNKDIREWFPTTIRDQEELVAWRILSAEEIEELTEILQNTKA